MPRMRVYKASFPAPTLKILQNVFSKILNLSSRRSCINPFYVKLNVFTNLTAFEGSQVQLFVLYILCQNT